jgi:WD40 repeat protein
MPALILVCLLAMPVMGPAEATPCAAPASAPAAPGDEYWAAGFNLPGMNGDVSALAVGPDGSLYAGGWFTTAGGVAASHIARLDGSQWHPLGSGMNGWVRALAVGPDGQVYAGGYFTTAGGVAANYIARWDGTSWHPLGSGMNNGVWALAVGPDGQVYAGGLFTSASGVAASRVARWDGTSWHPLGSGMTGGYEDPRVSALAFGPDGSLYAGGSFTTADGVAANNIARWDPVTSWWHPLGSGIGAVDHPDVLALAFGPDGSLYAGGRFTTAGGKPSSHIAQWTGEVPRPVAWFPAVLIDQ